MAQVRTVEFLPEIFQTPINRQFLDATLDQLTQEPSFQKTQGFVGRKVGPGVNPDDKYVIEPTKSRNDYQLEPGVVSLEPDSQNIKEIITYPGITDALNLQGAITDNSNRLYTSDYYAWDPFVDFDKLVNFNEYYWLPQGPLPVDVFASTIPTTDIFNVTRSNGVYTFSGVAGNNPTLTLVRGGNYDFNVAQNDKETVNFRVTNDSISSYVIDYQPNPTLTLVRGNTYNFDLSLNRPLPFYIKTQASLGITNTYDNGVSRNGAIDGTVQFVVPQDAPDTLFYSCSTEFNLRGTINIVDATPGTGPGFWIQTDPGVNGRIPATPNISSRDVLGVLNNGEDLGTVTFNVPLSTAQNFYYTLTNIGSVDLVTTLKFDQINNVFLEPFFEANPDGIDGITNLDGRTVVFVNTDTDPDTDGWQIVSQYDPLPSTAPNTGILGSFDTTLYSETTPITSQSQRYSVWQISYVTAEGGSRYMVLNSIEPVNEFEKFNILFGTEYASTEWYKNAEGFFERIPLLTAVKDLLFYQDGTDPDIFGQIRLIDQDKVSTLFIEDIIGQKNYTSPNGVVFTNGLQVTFRGDVEPPSYANNSYYVEGVGTAIQLLPVTNFITPETYTRSETIPYDSLPYDVGNYDASLNAPLDPDYLTINRASPDLNPWSRSNRWFHIDVINASAEYNNTVPLVDNLNKARRPILEFRAGTKLFDFGTQGKQPVNIIDFSATDALSDINGQTEYIVDDYEFVDGTRVIFANDSNPQVKNKIYQVQIITPDTVPPLIAQPIINLVPAPDTTVLVNQTVVCLSGANLQGLSFYFDGVNWIESQQKTSINQAPLFDVYDSAGISLSDRVKYLSSNFQGTKLFSYAVGGGLPDAVLGFPLRYLSLANVGDILFDNNLYADTFNSVNDAGVGQTQPISIGFVRQYRNRLDYDIEIGWQTAVTKSIARQQFQFSYDGSPLKLDIKVAQNNVVPPIQLFVGGKFQAPSNYSYTTTNDTTTIVLNTAYVPGDIIEVDVISDQVSGIGFYQVPVNLENNPFNVNSETFTLGTIRNHYSTIGQNLLTLQGPIIGANNSRDLGDIVPYGLQILQQSSPLSLAGYFMRSTEYDIFASIEYNNREYIKFKSLLLETVVRNDYGNMTTAEILDSAIADITKGRTEINPFYWSDMLPTGSVYTQTNYTITPISTSVFNTTQTYDFTTSNYLGLLVYLIRKDAPSEEILLERGYDYVTGVDTPNITVLVPLNVGDELVVREYSNTAGNFVPNTPTKLGLYPKFKPEIFYDTTYVNPVPVIRGHDGSITVAFDDYRTQILLEFEKRIYNNLKNDDNPVPLTIDQVQPGFFRSTDYTQQEITQILSESFLSWVGWNKIDYKAQDYLANNPFTYNYSSAGNKINEEPLPGAWRGMYRYFYDTEFPNTRPWEMLGFSEEPSWWQDRYGPAPYTGDNLVLWDDLEAGLVADPVAPYVLPQFVRPGLTKVIPAGSEGQLLSPLYSVVGQYNPLEFQKSWAVGDGGPAEYAWWTSSSYPFAVMRLLALTRPAEFFSLFADRDLYKYNLELDQYLYNGRYRLDANGVQVYGNGISKASYINWIVDYNQQLGRNSTTALTNDLANLDVRLCYRAASFTDKQYLRIYLERSAPESLNTSLLLPDESYNLLLYKNQPFSDIIYSALIVEKVQDGYAVYGYSNTDPYFNILASSSSGLLTTISAGGTSVRVPVQYTQNIVQIPYGYVFTNTTVVVDFILSYGAWLESQGLIFDDVENGYTLNWRQMAEEFLYFSQQGWSDGTMINLNPSANKLTAVRAGAVIDTIASLNPENMVLDQNRTVIPTRNLIIERNYNSFSVSSTNNQTISYLHLKFTNYESIVVLDNVSIFNDLIYYPPTGARQNRIRVVATTTSDWNGQLDARGFILNQDDIKEWLPNRKYTKGEIVLYKNVYWSAQTIVQPKLEFDYNDWVKSDWTKIQRGLLPNIANKADQLANSYNTYSANLERDNDLLSYGLIGFRPRKYMQDLNLDDVSQVNLYQNFTKSKGTRRSVELFNRADLGKENGEYSLYENWAILQGTYGANANRSFLELRMNEALLTSNPSSIQIVYPQQVSQANQTVFLDQIWRTSTPLTSTDIFPTTFVSTLDTALPSAGYVNIDDVDITVFSLNDPSAIEQDIDNIGTGTTIWVARTNSYDWNVYRCEQIPGRLTQLTDNLNATSIAQFTGAHGLSVGDLIIVRYFNDAVNGVYRVISIPSITSVVIAFAFNNTDQTQISGTGLVFYLQSVRVAQSSDLVDLSFANSLIPGNRAWVDNNGQGHWVVLEKQNQFSSTSALVPLLPVTNGKYGTSVAQTLNNFSALVGAPGTDTDVGEVFSYTRNLDGNYVYNVTLACNATDTVGFGNSISFGKQNWAIVGASNSNNSAGYAEVLYQIPSTADYDYSQLLVASDQEFDPIEFGSAVAISQDERWMYIGAPAGNRVYAYGRVDIENQFATYKGDGSTTAFNYADSIVIDYLQPDQLVVLVDGETVNYGTAYTITATDVDFLTAPNNGANIYIARRTEVLLDQSLYTNLLPLGGAGSGAEFTVQNIRGVYGVTATNPGTGYAVSNVLTILGSDIGGASPANDITITVTAVDSGTITDFTYTGSGISNTTMFQLDPYLYTATNLYAFTVFVNNVIQRPHLDYDFNTDSTATTQDLEFVTVPPAGAKIQVVARTYWQPVDVITVAGLAANARFGQSVATTTDGRQVFVGAPQDNVGANNDVGAVYAVDRSVIRYQVTNVNQLTYAIPGNFDEPISVILNGQFLNNSDQYVNGQFSVVGSDIVLDASVSLTVGDFLEIETNQFQEIEKISANSVFDEAAFGSAVAVCDTNCSVYIGSPLDGSVLTQAGSVDRVVNQSRVYGVTSSLVANPTLNVGDTLRINNFEIEVPADNTITGMINAINSANIPNVIASPTANLTFIGNGSTKVFNIGSLYSSAQSYTTVVYIDDVLQTAGVDYVYNNLAQQISFLATPAPETQIVVVSGRMTLSVKSLSAAREYNKLSVLPGVIGSAFEDLGFDTYIWTQTITSPKPSAYAFFGSSLDVNSNSINLIVGAPNGNVYEPMIFDGGKTYFDDRSTTVFSPVNNGGVAFTYDFLPSAEATITNPGKFVFGQQIYDTNIESNDLFGTSVSFVSGKLLVGSPNTDLGTSYTNSGRVGVFNNPDDKAAWTIIHEQKPVADTNLINGVFCYDKLTSTTQTYFDFFNPLQGKILGAARRNIDYIGAVDPASYNIGPIHNNGNSWANEHVGQIWWDTNTVRFLDPNQDNINYATRRWGEIFPGSQVDIYQWIESSVPPVQYSGPGTVLSTVSYSTITQLSQQNIFETNYYFWVKGLNTINTGAGKTLSTVGIARYIESPRSSGIPYVAFLNANTLGIYNAQQFISAQDTVLHVEYDQTPNDANVHTEFKLIADGLADSFLPATLYRKFQDSFCGADTAGNQVPDPILSPAEQFGVQFRPRQSMFADRFLALRNYLGYANAILKQFPITETKRFGLLNSAEPEPPSVIDTTTIWNKRVANLEELSYQNLQLVPVGYLYLVASNSEQEGLWTIYEVVAVGMLGAKELRLIRIQNYDTKQYWYHIDWYQPGYNSTIQPIAEVPVYSGLDTLTLQQVPVGSSVRVTANAQGKFEIYLRTDFGWDRVGLQDGTIQFKSELWDYIAGNFGFDSNVYDSKGFAFDKEPVIETRKIIQAINEDLFVDELLIERNRSLILMFEFIYSEFTAPDWLIKTSLVDVEHRIRSLLPYQIYLQDNQTFVLDYIKEVKPYHVVIREFNLVYSGSDQYPGMLTDFDVPAYWKTDLTIPQFVSPILLPYTQADTPIKSDISNTPANAEIWLSSPWKEWYNNYLLSIQSVSVLDGGVGYTVPPTVVVTGDCVEPAEMTAVINSAGKVVAVNITNPGAGYSTTAIISFEGGNGQGAKAIAVMGNDLVRSIKTVIRYDRYQYQTTILDWEPNVDYENGTMVRYVDRIWEANSGDSSAVNTPFFDPIDWILINASTVNLEYDSSQHYYTPIQLTTGVDRTMGLYVPTVNQPGLELPLLIDGIDYPGVQVTGLNFGQDLPLDAIYQSSYLDLYLGTRFTDINVDGGAYVDTYSSHAPEELVPGSEFDTLDFRVYTTPGSDWLGNGHGFPTGSKRYEFDTANPVLSFSNILTIPFVVEIFNVTQGLAIEPLFYDWANYEVELDTSTANTGDIINISVTGVGGGNQLYINTYLGSEVGNSLTVPFPSSAIYELLIYNGQTQLVPGTDYSFTTKYTEVGPQATYNPNGSSGTTLIVTSTLEISVGALIVGTGFTSGQTVVAKISATELAISSAPDSVPNGTLTFLANTNQTLVTFATTYGANDRINLCALGYPVSGSAKSWSLPVYQNFVITDASQLSYTLTNSLQGTNPANIIVIRNGSRARPYEGVKYIGNGITVTYDLPDRGGYPQDQIADNDVLVYVNNNLLTLNVDYSVDPYDISSLRSITFFTAPAAGDAILISVRTGAQYYVVGDQLQFRPSAGLSPQVGDYIQVITWNDTSEQDLLTQVFVGPTTEGVLIAEGYDSTTYSPASVNDTPGSYDYTIGSQIQINVFDTGRLDLDPDRILVTLNGKWLFNNIGYAIDGSSVVILGPTLNAADVVAITSFTNSVVPGAMEFRIFQDMRGIQATYRMTPATTTSLAQALPANSDIVYVNNASALSEPNFEANIWGVLTVNGERIMYRYRDTAANTVSGLLRGTAGTARADHALGSIVYDMGRGNLLPEEYQNYIVSNSTLADGSTEIFYADDIDLTSEDSTVSVESVEVYVGGSRQLSGYQVTNFGPVAVTFNQAPAEGSEVTILVRRGVTWYAPGAGTPSDGVPLQDTNTKAARFLRGL